MGCHLADLIVCGVYKRCFVSFKCIGRVDDGTVEVLKRFADVGLKDLSNDAIGFPLSQGGHDVNVDPAISMYPDLLGGAITEDARQKLAAVAKVFPQQ